MFNFDQNQKYLICTNRAGVFYGLIQEMDNNRNAVLIDSLMIFWWEQAAGLSQLAIAL
jgi:hypothetical protein